MHSTWTFSVNYGQQNWDWEVNLENSETSGVNNTKLISTTSQFAIATDANPMGQGVFFHFGHKITSAIKSKFQFGTSSDNTDYPHKIFWAIELHHNFPTATLRIEHMNLWLNMT